MPNVYYPTCDVRDVALAHVKALFTPEATGHRHIITSSTSFIPLKTCATILSEEYGPKGFKITTEVESAESRGEKSKINNSRMRNVLGLTHTDYKSTILDMAQSLIQYGIATPNKT